MKNEKKVNEKEPRIQELLFFIFDFSFLIIAKRHQH